MEFGEKLRSVAFWGLDRLRGGRVAFHLHDIARLGEDPGLLRARRSEDLEDLLSHATETTAYYRRFAGATSLQDFPVLQKRELRARQREFLSSAFNPHSLTTRTTSGSYGTPMSFLLSQEKAVRRQAEVIYFAKWAGYEIGMRHVQTRSTVIPSRLQLWMLNQRIINPTRMTDNWFAEQSHMLRTQQVKLVVSFPSVLTAIAAYCRACGDRPADYELRGIIATAELLSEEARSLIETAFGCPTLSRYTTEELGVLAQECPTGKHHHLNEASYVFELLDRDEDRPVAPGQPGRVVVTDLWSHAMPLIRYDLGDIAVMSEQCSCGWEGPVLKSIEGRVVETVYDSAGNRVSPFVVSGTMRDMEDVIQFQFVQHEPARYTMRLCTTSTFAAEELVRTRLLRILGRDAHLTFEYVDEIPPLASGKRPYVISEMKTPATAELPTLPR
ncbi:MAG: phenylacetate--CoA ligase family protein [Armatimonadetes bacterium]|nr:phenylacetate--CoA ligase family protein [Armatimonadota bacterium]